jgi:hypothetical protein
MRITSEHYFAGYMKPGQEHKGITNEHRVNAEVLLVKVNAMLDELATVYRCSLDVNPKTGTLISGTRNGGWRPKDCPEGSDRSSHKEGRGVDIYDPDGDLDSTITDAMLKKHGLYREHPSQTKSWLHLTDRAPGSGKRTFYA